MVAAPADPPAGDQPTTDPPAGQPAEDPDKPAEDPDGPAADWRAVKVAVHTEPPVELGDWLARTAAFDAAGADALWVDPGPEPELDVLALVAALAVVTHRARLVVALPEDAAPAATVARAVDTIRRLSRGRLALVAGAGQSARLAAGTPGVAVFETSLDEPGGFRCLPAGAGEVERWESVPAAAGRAALRTARVDAAGRGVHGLVVPAGPMLLDILRNPVDPGIRRDLFLAQG